MKKLLSRRSRGAALLITLISLSVFALLGVTVYRIIRSQVREVVYQERLAQAEYIAQAGLEDALHELYYNLSWKAGFSQKAFAGGYYTVTVSTDTPPLVTSTGYSKRIAIFGRAHSTVSARARVTYSNVSAVYAIMASNLAQVNGPARIDAYYPDVNLKPSAFVFGAGVWSNGSAATTTGASVNGNLYYSNTASIAAGTVAGSVIKSTTTQSLPNHTCGACKNKNNNATITGSAGCYNASTMDLNVGAGMTCSMKAGTFYFNNITVNGTLNIDPSTGSVLVYFKGIMNVGPQGAVNNITLVPSLLYFYGEASGNTHNVSPGAPLHAYIEEPAGNWTIGGTLYGHVWGSQVTLSGGGVIHADISGGNPNAASHVGWQRHSWYKGPRRL
jgi:Tfp pilus assembly protein PilX